MIAKLLDVHRRANTVHDEIAKKIGNTVYCGECRRVETVNGAHCLRYGWPKCCGGMTMYLGVPPWEQENA
jgi:hypothetical protein